MVGEMDEERLRRTPPRFSYKLLPGSSSWEETEGSTVPRCKKRCGNSGVLMPDWSLESAVQASPSQVAFTFGPRTKSDNSSRNFATLKLTETQFKPPTATCEHFVCCIYAFKAIFCIFCILKNFWYPLIHSRSPLLFRTELWNLGGCWAC